MASTTTTVNAVRFLTQSFRICALALTRLFANQFGLKDPSLIRTQGLINGKWVDGEDDGKITVTSSALLLSLPTVLG